MKTRTAPRHPHAPTPPITVGPVKPIQIAPPPTPAHTQSAPQIVPTPPAAPTPAPEQQPPRP